MVHRTIGRDKFINLMSELAGSVYDFHDRFDMGEVQIGDGVETVTDDMGVVRDMQRKIGLQIEELGEFSRALNKHDFTNMREEIIDNLYVALGTALVLGHLLKTDVDHVLFKNNSKTPENYITRYYRD